MDSEKREKLIKKILYKSSYRGCKETDLIIGSYAQKHANNMADEELLRFAEILEFPDTDFYDWYTGKKEIPNDKNSAILQKLMKFSPCE